MSKILIFEKVIVILLCCCSKELYPQSIAEVLSLGGGAKTSEIINTAEHEAMAKETHVEGHAFLSTIFR